MKKQLLLICILTAFFAFLKMQTLSAQGGSVLNLPGGSVTTSKMAIPPMNSIITAYPFTVEMWVKPNAIVAAGGFWVDRSGSVVSLQFTNDANGGLRTDIFGTSINATALAAVKPAINAWHHLSMIVRADSVVVECDGAFYAALNTKAFVSTFCSKASHIGVDSSANNSTRTVSGMFDEIRIWKSARTRSEILANKNVSLTGTETDLVAYYNFDNNDSNDKTTNVLNGVVTGGTIIDYNTVSTLTGVTLNNGALVPNFTSSTTIYTTKLPVDISSVTVTPGVTSAPGKATVSGSVTLNASNLTDTITCTGGDGISKTKYAFNFSPVVFDDWDSNGASGANSFPNLWGWNCSNSTTAWGATGTSANRYQDITVAGWYYLNTATPWTGRVLYLRWDGVGGTNVNSVFTYPVYLESCKTYKFTTKYGWVNNSTLPIMTFGFGTDKTGATTLLSDTALCTTKQYLKSKDLLFTPPTSGVYYLSVKSTTASLCAIADMSLTEYTGEILSANPSGVSFTDVNKTAEIIVTGNALSNNVIVSAPAGITLSSNTIIASETQCGAKITATYDYSAPVTNGKIYFVSGLNKDSVDFTYTKPVISIYERKIEVENNGKTYPLNVKSVNNSVDSLFVSTSDGFYAVKNSYSSADFVSGSGSVNIEIGSNAVVGTSAKLMFFTKQSGTIIKLDSITVSMVNAYPRYYIKNLLSGMVIGNHSSGLYPALTANSRVSSQKFFIRKLNINEAATVDTFYLVQDDTYKVIRKVPSSGWDTEFGIPANEAKWTRQVIGVDSFTITNVVTNKVLGADASTADSRLYDDKTYSVGSRMAWSFVDVAKTEIATLASLSLSTGTLEPAFSSDITSYTATLPYGTTSVKPTVVASIIGAAISGDTAIDVSSGTGVSNIVVTALDGVTQKTYNVVYSVAKSNIATLSDITADGTSISGFRSDSTLYTIIVPTNATSLPTIAGIATDSKAKVIVTPAVNLSDTTVITVTAEDGLTTKKYKVSFKSLVDGLKDLNRTIKIYPTISNGNFNIETGGKLCNVTVYDLNGRLISRKLAVTTGQSINVVNEGVYMIKVECNGTSKMVKVIKTN